MRGELRGRKDRREERCQEEVMNEYGVWGFGPDGSFPITGRILPNGGPSSPAGRGHSLSYKYLAEHFIPVDIICAGWPLFTVPTWHQGGLPTLG
jgi:hypothetical protein